MEYQVTLFCNNGKYKPVSCIVKSEKIDLKNKEDKKAIFNKGVQKIMIKRYWRTTDLKRYGYTSGKVREYDRKEIAAAAKARYDAIKEAKYQSGEWKRPKKSNSTDIRTH